MRSLLRTTTGGWTGAKGFSPEPHILIRHVRDRHAIRRWLVGFLSDCVDAVEAVGRWFIMEGSKL